MKVAHRGGGGERAARIKTTPATSDCGRAAARTSAGGGDGGEGAGGGWTLPHAVDVEVAAEDGADVGDAAERVEQREEVEERRVGGTREPRLDRDRVVCKTEGTRQRTRRRDNARTTRQRTDDVPTYTTTHKRRGNAHIMMRDNAQTTWQRTGNASTHMSTHGQHINSRMTHPLTVDASTHCQCIKACSMHGHCINARANASTQGRCINAGVTSQIVTSQ